MPVVLVMALLMGITVWTVNRRMTQQFRNEAAHNLATADTQRDAMKRSQSTEADAQTVHDEHRVVGRARRSHSGRLLRRAHLAWAPCPAK